ncbi:MAK10-like protein [Tanacetum coccineum]
MFIAVHPKPQGYRNTIELHVGNNVVPLRLDTIRLVQNKCSFYGLRSEDPNQHLKDFLKLMDSLDLNGENKERTRLRLFQFSLRDQASNWLECIPAGSITTWEDLTTHFLAQFFPSGRTAKLRNDILMFQQHHGESLSEAWTRFKDFLQKVPRHGIDLWLQDLALYDNKSWNDPRDLAKSVKAIALPQDVPMVPTTLSIAWKIPNKSLLNMHPRVPIKREIPNAYHTPPLQSTPSTNISQTSQLQTGMGIGMQQLGEPEPTLEDEFKDLHLNLPVLKVLAHALIYNTILDKYVESLELGKNGSAFIQGEVSAKMEDPGLFILPCRLGGSKPFDTLADLGSCVNIIPLYLFKNLNIGLSEETDHIFGLADGTNLTPESYKPRPGSDRVGAQIPYYARKDFLGCHLPEEWEIARDAEINPFKVVLVFRRMVDFLGAIPINLKSNM